MAPRCIDIMKKNICMKSDFHCHTNYSDGMNSIEEMVRAAINIGLKTLTITDHVRKDTKWIPDYLREIKYVRDRYRNKINILSGFEVKVLNLYGDLDAKEEWYNLVGIVLGAIHSIPSDNGFFSEGDTINKDLILSYWRKAFLGLMKNKKVTIIAHPFSELKLYGLCINKDIEDMLLSLARSEDKIIEISLRHLVPRNELIKRLLDAEINLVVGSDAHSVEELYSYHKQKRCYLNI